MTDTEQQTLPTPDAESPSDGSAAGRGAARTGRPAAKRGSLSSKLLPELQQIAGGLGIDISKKKKSDLVAAIQAAQGGGQSAPSAPSGPSGDGGGRSRAPKAAAETAAQAPTQAQPPASSAPARTTQAPQASAPAIEASAPPAQDTEQGGRRRERNRQQETAGDQNANGHNANGQSNGQNNGQNNAQNNGGQQSNRQNDRGNDNRGDRQNDGNQNRQNDNRGDRQNDGNQNRQNDGGNQNRQNDGGNQNRQNNQNNQQNNQNNNRQNDNRNDDDDDGNGRRRGRRYRDRRGRTRDRQGGGQGGGGNDAEPTVNEDDVLVPIAGIVDCIEDKNTWFVRVGGYFATPDDVFISTALVRKHGLRRGDAITGAVRQPREGERKEKYNPLVRVDTLNGGDADGRARKEFTRLTPLYPQERLRLETEPHLLTTRVIDLVMPIGKGQRALIVSPPKAGKTMIMQAIANAISTNNPECHLMVVLVDERPEEVTDMQRSVKGEVIASTFDRRPHDHTMVAELSIERAKRLVEMGHDVVVLLDSITRLGRAYNLAAPASGRILSGGVDSTALYQPKRFLGAARNIENGGSLTIIASALVETGSAGDTVFFEEYKGTGNAELKLDRKIADKRVFPAVDVDQSSTRKEEILLSPDELAVTIKLRRVLHALDSQQAIELLLDRLRKSRTNFEFLMNIAKTTPGQDDR
ncbi:transcription termination factor Rho [Jatrophihabitans fulvus]